LLDGERKLKYNQYTVDPGVFYRYYLGKNTGFGPEASKRYWFCFGSYLDAEGDDTLDGDDYKFTDSNGNASVFDTNVNVSFGLNVALIYTFGRNK
jgi:hypothetical protein